MDDYSWFKQRLYSFSGIDLSHYKEDQMKRRLTTFRNKHGYDSFTLLFKMMVKSTVLYDAFLDHMTINVTEFYRNKQRWDVLEQRILPKLLQRKSSLKIWSAACSTGEEPYTIAMILSRYISLSKVKIIATDIDKNVLSFAKQANYPERVLKEVPQDIRKKYFIQDNERYRVVDAIRQSIIFKQHNLLSEKFDGQFDLIICRNVLIYFTDEAKLLLYKKFNQALSDQGLLFVGSTEQIFNPQSHGFQVIESFFYQKLNNQNI